MVPYRDASPETRVWLSQRILGAVLGSAIGDCAGGLTEYKTREQTLKRFGDTGDIDLNERTSSVSSGVATPPGLAGASNHTRWRADTDHTILILQSFLELKPRNLGMDEVDFAQRLHRYYEHGIPELDKPPIVRGETTVVVTQLKGYLEDPTTVSMRHWIATGRGCHTNGGILRSGIVGACDWSSPVEFSMDSAIRLTGITHADPRCKFASAIGAGIVATIMNGAYEDDDSLNECIEYAANELANVRTGPILYLADIVALNTLIWTDNVADLELDDAATCTDSFKTLAAAVWCLRQAVKRLPPLDVRGSPTETRAALFTDLIQTIVMQGGDADTNAALAGTLLGAYLGSTGLPPVWSQAVRDLDWLAALAERVIAKLHLPPSTEIVPPRPPVVASDSDSDGSPPASSPQTPRDDIRPKAKPKPRRLDGLDDFILQRRLSRLEVQSSQT